MIAVLYEYKKQIMVIWAKSMKFYTSLVYIY